MFAEESAWGPTVSRAGIRAPSGLEEADLPSNHKARADELFATAYSEFGDTIYRYCLYRTGSSAEAEDISADVFARLYSVGLGELNGDGHLRPWLFKVAGNLCINHLKRQQYVAAPRIELEVSARTLPSEPSMDTEIIGAFKHLKAAEQTAVYLRAIEDLSFSDVSRAMEKREGAAKMLFYRGAKKLRRQLEGGKTDV